MATFLFAWELGSGLGHVTVIQPLAAKLRERGHKVFVALRDMTNAQRIFGECGIEWLAAPIRSGPPKQPLMPTRTFAQLLHNTVFGDRDEALGLVKAWLNLFELVRPDVVVGDHSPTALLAARLRRLPRAALGPGFYCPALCEWYPDWRPWLGEAKEQLRRDELRVLDLVNAVSKSLGGSALARLSELYACDLTLLTTYPELDPFGKRPDIRYRGVWGQGPGVAPWWPPKPGKRIFAYVRKFKGLGNLLDVLRGSKQPSIVYASGAPTALLKTFMCDTIAFATKPVEFTAAAAQCDIAISHGSHGTAAGMLSAGKPQLLFPQHLEQRLTAQAVVHCGAGLAAKPEDRDHIRERLERLLNHGRFAVFAGRRSKRCGKHSAGEAVELAANEVEGLLG
jgi:UDP:flavonoid glycosyltransferase YjiC (YdhE family)